MTDHPLYLKNVTLLDGLSGTIVLVYDDGAAFDMELHGADDVITIYPDDITGPYGLIARHRPAMAMMERGEGFTLDLSDLSPEDFAAFLTMSLSEQKVAFGDFHSVQFTAVSGERFSAWLRSRFRDRNGHDHD